MPRWGMEAGSVLGIAAVALLPPTPLSASIAPPPRTRDSLKGYPLEDAASPVSLDVTHRFIQDAVSELTVIGIICRGPSVCQAMS